SFWRCSGAESSRKSSRMNEVPAAPAGIFFLQLSVFRKTVAHAAAFDGCQSGRETTGQKCRRKPERELGGSLAGFVGGCLGPIDHVVHALLGFGLRQPGARGNKLRDAGAIRRRELASRRQP